MFQTWDISLHFDFLQDRLVFMIDD